jgi:glycosyltransferase involved in cell wall biosynthesis
MQAADAFVLPSVAEGMSNALFEAMGCGLACIVTSAIGGVDELVGADRGLVAPPLDSTAWAGAMRYLATDPPLRQTVGDAAARYVHERYSLDRTADLLSDLYRELCSA